MIEVPVLIALLWCVGKVTEQNLGKDFETLLGMLRPEESVNKEDIRILKEQIFGPNVFWVTGTRTTDDVLDRGIVVSLKAEPLDPDHAMPFVLTMPYQSIVMPIPPKMIFTC